MYHYNDTKTSENLSLYPYNDAKSSGNLSLYPYNDIKSIGNLSSYPYNDAKTSENLSSYPYNDYFGFCERLLSAASAHNGCGAGLSLRPSRLSDIQMR